MSDYKELIDDLRNPRGHYIGDGEFRAASPSRTGLLCADAIEALLAENAALNDLLRECKEYIRSRSRCLLPAGNDYDSLFVRIDAANQGRTGGK